MKTYEFKLYRTKKEQHLWKQLDIANEVWNFCITARRWHFKQTGKSLQTFSLQKIITQVKKAPMYQHWNALNSQAIANQADRVWLSYEAFFANLKLPKKERRKISLPGYKKRSKQKSFTLRQVGEALDQQHNRIRIGGKWFKYHKSREVEGNIKTITVKQNKLGEWFIYVVSDHTETAKQTRTGKSVGFDFGLKQFLTGSDGSVFTMPLLFKRTLRELAKAHRNVSRAKRGSRNRKRALKHLNRVHQKVSNARKDFHWKLAKHLVQTYEVICLETLNLKGMRALWGRKVSDLGFYSFVQKLKHQANKHGTTLIFIDRWFPSSKQCFSCKLINNELHLRDREWSCICGSHNDRDHNASLNIYEEGARLFAIGNDSDADGISSATKRKEGTIANIHCCDPVSFEALQE